MGEKRSTDIWKQETEQSQEEKDTQGQQEQRKKGEQQILARETTED